MEIRIRETGEVLSEEAFRELHEGLPEVLTELDLDALGADIVGEGVRPNPTLWFQKVERSGVEQVEGKWVARYVLTPAEPTEAFLLVAAAARRRELCDRIDVERNRRFYSDVEVEFPTGPRLIQFRDEFDRANFANTAQAAQMMIIMGQGEAPMSYITTDNMTQYLTANELAGIGLQVMAAKQEIMHTARQKKDEVMALGIELADLEALTNYQPTQGWPGDV